MKENLKSAAKDNDLIYMEIVPAAAALSDITAADMVKPVFPEELEEIQRSKPNLFTRLVPFAVHESSSLYSTQKDEHVRGLTSSLDTKEGEISSIVENKKFQFDENSDNRLPQDICDAMEDFKKRNVRVSLPNAILQLKSMTTVVQNMINESQDILDRERVEDDELRSQFAQRWTRQSSLSLTKSIVDTLAIYREKLAEASQSDGGIMEKYKSVENVLKLLGSTREQVEASLPAAPSLKPLANHPSVISLKDCMFQLKTIKQSYMSLRDELKKRSSEDDIRTITSTNFSD